MLVQLGVNEFDKQRVGEEDGRRVVGVVRVEVRATGEGIRSGKEMAWDVDDLEVKVSKIKQPSCLASVEVLCLTEVHQVFVVGEDLDGEQGSVEVMSPGLQSADNGKELFVIDIIVSFRRDE